MAHSAEHWAPRNGETVQVVIESNGPTGCLLVPVSRSARDLNRRVKGRWIVPTTGGLETIRREITNRDGPELAARRSGSDW